jgi:hypothetical protein
MERVMNMIFNEVDSATQKVGPTSIFSGTEGDEFLGLRENSVRSIATLEPQELTKFLEFCANKIHVERNSRKNKPSFGQD